MGSRTLQDLCCLTQATLFNVCLSEADLKELGAWHPGPNRPGFSPAVWSRAALHKECRKSSDAAARLTDHLDLRYLDTVMLIRGMEQPELERIVQLWIERPDGRALPGLLWSLCTDPRPQVHALGSRFCHEATAAACSALVKSGASEERSSSANAVR